MRVRAPPSPKLNFTDPKKRVQQQNPVVAYVMIPNYAMGGTKKILVIPGPCSLTPKPKPVVWGLGVAGLGDFMALVLGLKRSQRWHQPDATSDAANSAEMSIPSA